MFCSQKQETKSADTLVALYPASRQDEADFDWLRRDTLQAVGDKRVVKETGDEIG